jgi:DNA invertase Pin-like site-specific DNA recombinase
VSANDTDTVITNPQTGSVEKLASGINVGERYRLSRSVLHLVILGAELRERSIGLHVIEQGIDTSTLEGRAMFGMPSVLAELQRELIVANTNDGLASARARGASAGAGRSSPRTRPRSPSGSTTSGFES